MEIKTYRLKEGMMIQRDVYLSNGLILVPAGTEITQEVIVLLKNHLVEEVFVESGVKSKSKRLKEFTETFQIAETVLEKNLKDIVERGKEIEVSVLLASVQKIVDKTSGEIDLCNMLYHMQELSQTLYAHSINVALYSKLLAEWNSFSREETELAVLSGLLHDIGHISYAECCFLHEELENRQHAKHTVRGYNILRRKEINYRVKQAVLTHHERLDGSGFPMGVTYQNISPIARVISIADVYATLTIEEKEHPPMHPFEILSFMQNLELGKLDSVYLHNFLKHIAQSYIQCSVLLDNGRQGKIVMVNKMDLTRPLIETDTKFIDLAIDRSVNIKKILL